MSWSRHRSAPYLSSAANRADFIRAAAFMIALADAANADAEYQRWLHRVLEMLVSRGIPSRLTCRYVKHASHH